MHVKLKPTANRLFKLLVKTQQQQRGAITMTGTWSYMVTVDFLQALQPLPLTSPPCNPFSAQQLKPKLEKGKCKARRTDSNWDHAKAYMCVCMCACVFLYVPVCVSFFLMKCPRRGAAGGNSLSQGALQNCILLHVRLILPNPWTEPSGAKSHSPLLNGEFMFIFTNRWTYIRMNLCVHVCVPVSCVAHVAEPQGVGELLASNWNCRFNILNYRLANGQYFVTTLPAPPPLPYCLLPPLPLLCLELPQTITCTHQIVPHKLYCNKQSITLCVFPALDSHQFSSLPSPTWEGQLLEGVRLFGIRLFTETFHRFAVVVVAVAYSSWDCYI